MNKLKILNLAFTDEGGAGIASIYFNELFEKAGHESKLVVQKSKAQNKNVVVLQKYKYKYSIRYLFYKLKNLLFLKMDKKKLGESNPQYCFSNYSDQRKYTSTVRILKKTPFKPDIIVLHWVSIFLNSKMINELQERTNAKIIWIMMDNAPLTGGCHYPWECNGYTLNCSNCPAILENNKKIIAQNIFKSKQHNLPKNIELVSCSETDFNRALKATLFQNNKKHKILFPLDEKKFKPSDKQKAKEFWGIDYRKKVLFYGSTSLVDKRKGSEIFLEALKKLQTDFENDGIDYEDVVILISGNNNLNFINNFKFQIKITGYLNEENLIKAYQASDLYVSTSLEDSGPLMVNQSIMCGTPVVAFNVGVAVDLVKSGETGYIAKFRDSQDLAKGIKTIFDLTKTDYGLMSQKCREIALNSFSTEVTIKNWNSIFYNT